MGSNTWNNVHLEEINNVGVKHTEPIEKLDNSN